MIVAWVRSWSWRHRLVATAAFTVTLVLIGVPTGLITTPLYHRMTPVLWWNYPVWVATGVLTALLAATYVTPTPTGTPTRGGRTMLGSIGSLLSVGCPICNKIVVALIGIDGALSIFAPIQPYLGLLSLLLLVVALRQRRRFAASCPIRPPAQADRPGERPDVEASP